MKVNGKTARITFFTGIGLNFIIANMAFYYETANLMPIPAFFFLQLQLAELALPAVNSG
jgi:uncharacterized membrane protein YhaH (DUF805 family)